MAQAKPDAIAMLKADHRHVEELFERFEKARGDERKATLAREICTELIIHTLIEEEIFYPAFRDRIEQKLLDEAYVEHDGAKLMIAEILAGRPGEDFFDAKVSVLSEEIDHHVREEERPSEGMFAQARATGEDMDALADRMRARKEELKAEFEARGLPTPTTRSLTGARVEIGEPVG